MATDPIILDRQILGLIKWTLQSHHKRQEDKSIIVRTYKAQNPCTNGKKSEKARRCQYDMQQKPAEQGEDIRSKVEMGILRLCTLWERKVIPKRPSTNRCSCLGWQGVCPLGHEKREMSREGSKQESTLNTLNHTIRKSHHKKIHFLSTSHRGALKISKCQECQHPFLSLPTEGQCHVPYLSGTSARCIPTSPLPAAEEWAHPQINAILWPPMWPWFKCLQKKASLRNILAFSASS